MPFLVYPIAEKSALFRAVECADLEKVKACLESDEPALNEVRRFSIDHPSSRSSTFHQGTALDFALFHMAYHLTWATQQTDVLEYLHKRGVALKSCRRAAFLAGTMVHNNHKKIAPSFMLRALSVLNKAGALWESKPLLGGPSAAFNVFEAIPEAARWLPMGEAWLRSKGWAEAPDGWARRLTSPSSLFEAVAQFDAQETQLLMNEGADIERVAFFKINHAGVRQTSLHRGTALEQVLFVLGLPDRYPIQKMVDTVGVLVGGGAKLPRPYLAARLASNMVRIGQELKGVCPSGMALQTLLTHLRTAGMDWDRFASLCPSNAVIDAMNLSQSLKATLPPAAVASSTNRPRF